MSKRAIGNHSLRTLFKESEKLEIPVNNLIPYHNHCFELYDEGRLWNLADSISDNGLISPVIVRSLDTGQYEILSGHNRVEAFKLLGKIVIECRIIEADDANASVIVIESNLEQRSFSEMKMSSQIRVIAEYYVAIKKQGVRTDLVEVIDQLTSGHSGQKLSTRKAVARKFNLSERKMARLIKMNSLIDELKNMLDIKSLKFMVAYELSYLSQEHQKIVFEFVKDSNEVFKKEQAEKIKKASLEGIINRDVILAILNEKKSREDHQRIKVTNVLSVYFEMGISDEQLDEIEKFVKMNFKNVSH